MSIIDRLDELLANNPLCRAFRLSPDRYCEYLFHVGNSSKANHTGGPILEDGLVTHYYMGKQIICDTPKTSCRKCGAPTEPHECSFCKTPSEWEEVQ